MMKNYISENDLIALEDLLMRLQVPYHVSFDAHVDESLKSVTYDKYIRIEPIVIQKEVEYK